MSIVTKVIFLVVMLFASCIGFQKKCQAPLSSECSHYIDLWQNAIDSIILANFPSEIGYYRSVVWEDDFDNAWVNKGSEVNITRQFIQKLNHSQRIFVAAHELAHLKLGHYYSKVGIIIPTQIPPVNNSYQNQSFGHYASTVKRGKTVMAKGSAGMERDHNTHGAPLPDDEIYATKDALGLAPESFFLPDEVKSHFRSRFDLLYKTNKGYF